MQNCLMKFPLYSLFLVFAFGCLIPRQINAQIAEGDNLYSTLLVDKIYTITEFEAVFPGGQFARKKYFYNNIDQNRKDLNSDGVQFCYLKFIVDKEGNISNITTNKIVNTKLDDLVIDLLKKGPKWIPARQNGVKVNSYATLTFIFESNKSGKPAFARNSIKYFITKENKIEKQFQKILVLVAGTVPARIFTDQLYENLKTELKNIDIETEYIFLGNERKLAMDNFMNISRSRSYDAVLLFIQEDGAKINETYYETEISIRSVSLKQSMNIFLIEPVDLDTPILEAKVFMNFQLLKKPAYSKASKEFLSLLKENRIGKTGADLYK